MRKKQISKKLILSIAVAAMTACAFFGQVKADTTEEVGGALSGIAITAKGNMYLTDSSKHVIYLRGKDGTMKVAAGTVDVAGNKDGAAAKATFSQPWDIVSYNKGYAISDAGSNRIRFLKQNKVKTILAKSLKNPTGLAVGTKGELYIADTGNNRIVVMDKNGKIKTFAGAKTAGCKDGTLKKARLCEPTGLCYYKKALYVADSGNHRIVKISGGKVTTVAGSAKGIEGDSDGKIKTARLSNPQGVCLKGGVMYIADSGNAAIRKVSNGKISTLISGFSMEGGRIPAQPRKLAVDGKKLYFTDVFAEELIDVEL